MRISQNDSFLDVCKPKGKCQVAMEDAALSHAIFFLLLDAGSLHLFCLTCYMKVFGKKVPQLICSSTDLWYWFGSVTQCDLIGSSGDTCSSHVHQSCICSWYEIYFKEKLSWKETL